MADELRASVARSLDAEVALLPWLPELLADLDALGGDPSRTVALLRPWARAGMRVADVGCGKGATAVACARALGCSVVGVDAMAPFVEDARRRAAEAGVGDRCEFRVGDGREFVAGAERFDAALLIGLGDALGGVGETVAALRRIVRPGGVMLIDDGYLVGPAEAGLERYHPLEETRLLMTQWGDEIVAEEAATEEGQRGAERRLAGLIRARAEALARSWPEVAALALEYAAAQERAAGLAGTIRYAAWVLRRGA